jgi:membrane-associated protease RseP (regulator of RpoE activity)
MISFSLFNIPVRVLPWFWITLALIGVLLNDQADSKESVLRILLFMVAGFISILVHELGHALTAKHFGKKVYIVLQTFGGYAAYSGGAPLSRTQSFLITAAGPAIQILLAILVLILSISLGEIEPQAAYFLGILIWISFAWAILNLLPVLPLDGGRLLETVLGPNRIQLTLKICIGVAAAIAFLSLMLKPGFMLPIFMGFMAYENYKALKQVSWR